MIEVPLSQHACMPLLAAIGVKPAERLCVGADYVDSPPGHIKGCRSQDRIRWARLPRMDTRDAWESQSPRWLCQPGWKGGTRGSKGGLGMRTRESRHALLFACLEPSVKAASPACLDSHLEEGEAVTRLPWVNLRNERCCDVPHEPDNSPAGRHQRNRRSVELCPGASGSQSLCHQASAFKGVVSTRWSPPGHARAAPSLPQLQFQCSDIPSSHQLSVTCNACLSPLTHASHRGPAALPSQHNIPPAGRPDSRTPHYKLGATHQLWTPTALSLCLCASPPV